MKTPKKSTEMKTSKAERRRKFDPRKWARKHLKEDPLPLKVAIVNQDYWKGMPDCSKCKGTTGAMMKKKGKWYCFWCEDSVEGEVEEEIRAGHNN